MVPKERFELSRYCYFASASKAGVSAFHHSGMKLVAKERFELSSHFWRQGLNLLCLLFITRLDLERPVRFELTSSGTQPEILDHYTKERSENGWGGKIRTCVKLSPKLSGVNQTDPRPNRHVFPCGQIEIAGSTGHPVFPGSHAYRLLPGGSV